MGLTADLQGRLRAAFAAATADEAGARERLEALFARAHAEAADVLDGKRAHSALASVATAWAGLRDDVASLDTHLRADLPVHVGADGTLWGLGTYLQFDPGWAEALVHYFENRDHKAPFRTTPRVIDIADTVRLGIVGDWGTGFWRPGTGAERVRDLMAADRADINIHLGDTYYAGSSAEEPSKLVAVWPAGAQASFTLNSNHEMYDGARAYFDVALAAPAFAAQGGTSYFALRNSHWLIIGLDTGYYATGELYLEGAIDAIQGGFLGRLGATAGDRRIMVLTHHEGADLPGQTTTTLWQQVTSCLGRAPDAWYWGHAHNGVVYAPIDGCRARCIGHGAIPYGAASMLAGVPSVLWSETVSAKDPSQPERVTNGYARVTLDGPTLTEELVAEDGGVRWQGRA